MASSTVVPPVPVAEASDDIFHLPTWELLQLGYDLTEVDAELDRRLAAGKEMRAARFEAAKGPTWAEFKETRTSWGALRPEFEEVV